MSPRMALVFGLVFVITGGCLILVASGVVPLNPAADTQTRPSVIIAAGLVFVFGGPSAVVGFVVAGGVAPDGDLPVGTPMGIRVLQYLLGLGFVASLAAVFTWIAFGIGERHFSGSLSIPFVTRSVASSASAGRTVFGVGAVFLWIVLVGLGATGARRLLQARQKQL